MKTLLTVSLFAFFSSMPHAAQAFYGTGLEMSVGRIYCNLFQIMQGPVMQAIAIISVVILAVSAMYGKVELSTIVMVTVAIAVLFGSMVIVDMVMGDGFFSDESTEESCNKARAGKTITDVTKAGTIGASIASDLYQDKAKDSLNAFIDKFHKK